MPFRSVKLGEDNVNYYKELSDQLMLLLNGEKAKIDVHFIVSEPLISFCYEVNKKIRTRNFGLINMGIENIVVPHISVFMGFVDSPTMLENVLLSIHEFSKTLDTFTITPTSMYFKGVSKTEPQYLFIDCLQNDLLMMQKEAISSLLFNKTYPIGWDMKSERAHITVGCYKNLTQSVQDDVDSFKIIPACKISQIGISFSGQKGVCLGLIKSFELGKE